MKKKILFISLILISFVFSIELISYLSIKFFESSRLNKAGIDSLYLFEGRVSKAKITSNPYSLYWNNPNFFDDDYGLIYNAQGYRSRPIESYSSDAVRVLALGGSTTNSWPYVKDNAKIWTSITEGFLSRETQKDFMIMNAGLPYGTTAELLSHYIFIGKYLNPKYVVYHGGGNDIAPLLFDGYATDYSHFRWSQSGSFIKPWLRKLIDSSNLFKLIFSLSFESRPTSGQPYSFAEINREEARVRFEKSTSEAFRSNLSLIISECTANNREVVLVGFLQARSEFMSRNRRDLKGLEQIFLDGAARHDAIMMDLAEQHESVHFIKLDQSRFDDEWFLDNCHLNENGEAEKARQIAEFMKGIVESEIPTGAGR